MSTWVNELLLSIFSIETSEVNGRLKRLVAWSKTELHKYKVYDNSLKLEKVYCNIKSYNFFMYIHIPWNIIIIILKLMD